MCAQQNTKFDVDDKKHFFGNYYDEPLNFRFSDDDKKQILDLVLHFNGECDTDNDANQGINIISNSLCRLVLHDDVPADNSEVDDDEGWYFGYTDFMSETEEIPIFPPYKSTDIIEENSEQDSQTHKILRKLIMAADQNINRSSAGYRFDPDVKEWAAYLRMLSGPLAYRTLQENLPLSLPSISSLNKYIQSTRIITEGVIRSQELLLHLERRNLPLTVALSEDATRIVDAIQYDSLTNQLIGFVLPIDSTNGIPIPFAYKARSTEEIVGHFLSNTPIASFVNTIMAQPIAKEPPFCLLLFGTDSKYTSFDVSKRWNHIVSELKKVKIDVLTIASDSDPKYNTAMRRNSMLGYPSRLFNSDWFSCGDGLNNPFYVQDMTHIATKLRNY